MHNSSPQISRRAFSQRSRYQMMRSLAGVGEVLRINAPASQPSEMPSRDKDITAKIQLAFVDLGEQRLKNIAQSVGFIESQANSSWLREWQSQLLLSLTSLQLRCFLSRT